MSALLRGHALLLPSFSTEVGFDIRIEKGQRWLLTGDSGSGKSTLMRTLLGLVSPRDGLVFLHGRNLHDVSPAELLRLRQSTSVVFSGGGLLPAWSGLENLMLPLRAIRGMDEHDAHQAVLDFASRGQLPTPWLERIATQLSAEQATLLSLARALITEPELLWIDSELVWGVLSHANTHLGAELAAQVDRGCTLVTVAGEHGVPREQMPPCGVPTHRAHLQSGWLECLIPPTHWTLDPADDQTPRA